MPTPQPRSLLYLFVCLLALAATPGIVRAQALAAGPGKGGSASSTSSNGPAGIVPAQTGFNASLTTATQHDSSSGWASLLNPTLAYRLNSHLSADATLPIYSYISIDARRGTKAKPVYKYVTKHGALGDTALAAHLDLSPSLFDYTLTGTLGIPTGKPAYGLGAGKVTYNLTNHFEKELGIFTPDIEAGAGDSNSLLGRRVRKSFTSVGTLANFQAGTSIDLPHGIEFESDAYEQLPLTNSTIYSNTGRGKKKVTVVLSTGSAEDNGFNNSLDIPFGGHLMLSGFYNRSLRLHDDVAGFSLTFLLKAPPPPVDIVK